MAKKVKKRDDNLSLSNQKKTLLSISLLSSGRENTIEKCLLSLQPLRDRLSAEIIVVDTSVDENKEVEEILRKYATDIVKFKWCDDFAKARNAGLKKATGKWFMFLDDDEWFEDVEDIVRFFESGEYQSYRCASYVIRNYDDFEGKSYQDESILRMMEITEGFHFKGRIHEYASTVYNPQKYLKSMIHHYGYVFRNDKEKFAHAERNISLLKNVIEDEPDNPRWWVQLALEYKALNVPEKVTGSCDKGLETLRGRKDKADIRHRGILLVEKMTMLHNASEWQKLIELFGKKNAYGEINRAAEALCNMLAAGAYLEKKDYENALACGKRYAEIYQKTKSDESMAEELQLSLAGTFGKKYQSMVHAVMIQAGICLGDWTAYEMYMDSLEWENEAGNVFQTFVVAIFDNALERDYDGHLPDFIDHICRASWSFALLQERFVQTANTDEHVFWILARAIAESTTYNWLGLVARIIWYDHINDVEHDYKKSFEKLFSEVADVFSLPLKLWEAAKNRNVDINSLLSDVPFDVVKYGVDRLMEVDDSRTVPKTLEKLIKIMDGFNADESLRLTYFDICAKKKYLMRWESKQDGITDTKTAFEDQYHWLGMKLNDFCNECIDFYSNYYTDMAIEENIPFLPNDCRMAIKLRKALEEDDFKTKNKLLLLKNTLKSDEEFDTVIVYFTHLYGEYIKSKQQQPADEMQQLIDNLQSKVEELISAGMMDEAEMVMKEIEKYAPVVAGNDMV